VKGGEVAAKRNKKPASPSPPLAPTIFFATIGLPGTAFDGAVIKGAVASFDEAVLGRRAGHDVVVCGDDLAANRKLAAMIEGNANGAWRRCPPHAGAGPFALPHYQPEDRPPSGHTFYETEIRKAR
jgi:hypothetical protein